MLDSTVASKASFKSVYLFLLLLLVIACSPDNQQAGKKSLLPIRQNIDSLLQADPDSIKNVIKAYRQIQPTLQTSPALQKGFLEIELTYQQQQQNWDSLTLVIQQLSELYLQEKDTLPLVRLVQIPDYGQLSHTSDLLMSKLLQLTNRYLINQSRQDEAAHNIQQLLANTLIEIDDFASAYEVLLSAMNNALQTDKPLRHASIYATMGVLYYKQEQFEQSKEQYQKIVALTESSLQQEDFRSAYLSALTNLGIAYKQLQQPDSAIICYQKILQLTPDDKPVLRLKSLLNLGNAYLDKGNYSRALQLYQEVSQKSRAMQIKPGIVISEFNIGNLWIQQGAYQKGIDYILQNIDPAMVRDAVGPDMLFTLNKALEKGYQNLGQYQAAYEVANKVATYRDSVQSTENNLLVKDLENYFQAEKLSLQNQLLDVQQRKRNVWLWFLLVGALGLVLTAGLVARNYYRQKQSSKQYQLLLKNMQKALQARDTALTEKHTTYQKLIRMEQDNMLHLNQQLELFRTQLTEEVQQMTFLNDDQFWLDFSLSFQLLFPNFETRLLEQYPSLTQADLRFCKLVRVNLPPSEIARLLSVAPRSLHMKKQRIFEKMGVPTNEHKELIDYLPAT